jgi:hypothetical protein
VEAAAPAPDRLSRTEEIPYCGAPDVFALIFGIKGAALGHEDQFTARALSDSYRIGEQTFSS